MIGEVSTRQSSLLSIRSENSILHIGFPGFDSINRLSGIGSFDWLHRVVLVSLVGSLIRERGFAPIGRRGSLCDVVAHPEGDDGPRHYWELASP
jgi:hypothetical protein